MADNKPELQRGLEARHIELIALGGTIGVGLFMGAASTLKWAGPSVLLAYIIAGLFVFFIMRSMGEMLFLEPVTGSFAVYAHRYMSPFFGYLTAWSYWFMWMAVGISEITAIGVYVQFWFPEMAQWIPALIAVALVALASFTTQNVNVQVLTTFNANFWFHFYWNFTVFNVTQFAYCNHFIFCITCFCNDATRFAFFAVQQPEKSSLLPPPLRPVSRCGLSGGQT